MMRRVKRRIWKLPADGTICLTLGLITLALYAPCLSHEFLTYDDQQYVTENRHVQAGLTWPGMAWACRTFYASNWHPLTWISHMLDCQLYGLQPLGHHLSSVLLHTASSMLLFLVLKRMTGATWRSAAVAALFAWHPLHVESVAWIAERKDVLSGLFWMLTLWAYVRYAQERAGGVMEHGSDGDEKSEGRNPKAERNPKSEARNLNSEIHHTATPAPLHSITPLPHSAAAARIYALSLFFFALGLMSKPMLVTLPFVLLLLDFWPLQRLPGAGSPLRVLAEKLPFLALSAGCCCLTVLAQRQGQTIVSAAALPLSRRIAHAILAYAHYLAAMFAPRNLAVAYAYSPSTPGAEILGAATMLGVVSLVVVAWARRRPYLLVGWFWYLGTLVPVIGLVQVGDQAWADRYTYLPLIGLFVALAWGVADLVRGMGAHRLPADPATGSSRAAGPEPALVGLAVLAGLGLLGATAHQVRYWKDTRTLFEHSSRVNPQSSRALAVLGSLLATEGKLAQAEDFYHRALALRADDPEAHYLLGAALEQRGELDQALAHYAQALWSRPLQERTYLAQGMVLARQGKYADAAAADRNALALNPDCALAHNNLARVLHTQGRPEEAIQEYAAALRSDPTLAQAHNNLGVLLLQKGELAEGAAQLAEAARLQPDNFEFRYNLATALNQEKRWGQAAEVLSSLAAGHPGDPNLNCQLALALAHLQKTKEAMSNYALALLRQPDFPEALDGLAWILATDPHAEFRNGVEAVRMAEGACALTKRRQAPLLATLAAAYGEAGRFPEAIAAAKEAQQLAASSGQKEIEDRCRALLETLKSGRPWRETMR
jgi:tetratricopeptide (TPR) repeat protein